MAYRNPLAWDRNLRPGLFKSDPNATLPRAASYEETMQKSQLEIDLQLEKDYAEIDRMNEELDALYVRSMMPPVKSTVIPYSQVHTIEGI